MLVLRTSPSRGGMSGELEHSGISAFSGPVCYARWVVWFKSHPMASLAWVDIVSIERDLVLRRSS